MSKVIQLWVDRPNGGRAKAVQKGRPLPGSGRFVLVEGVRSAAEARLVYASHLRAVSLGEDGIDALEDNAEVGSLRRSLRQVRDAPKVKAAARRAAPIHKCGQALEEAARGS